MARATKATGKSTKKAVAAKKTAARRSGGSATSAGKAAATGKTTTASRSRGATKAASSTAASKATKAATGRAAGATKKAAAKGAPLDKFLEGQLKILEAERANYTHQATSLRAEADLLAAEREPGDVQFDEESGEGDTLAVERERDLALSAQAQAAVEEIDLAIARIHAGTYGICENCGTKIPRERLKALPFASLCVQCKSGGFARR